MVNKTYMCVTQNLLITVAANYTAARNPTAYMYKYNSKAKSSIN